MNIFGERLAELRKFNSLTQEELSNQLNVTSTSISNYERGRKCPSDETKLLIAQTFNVSLDYLLGATREEYKLDRSDILKLPTSFSPEEKYELLNYADYVIQKRNR